MPHVTSTGICLDYGYDPCLCLGSCAGTCPCCGCDVVVLGCCCGCGCRIVPIVFCGVTSIDVNQENCQTAMRKSYVAARYPGTLRHKATLRVTGDVRHDSACIASKDSIAEQSRTAARTGTGWETVCRSAGGRARSGGARPRQPPLPASSVRPPRCPSSPVRFVANINVYLILYSACKP